MGSQRIKQQSSPNSSATMLRKKYSQLPTPYNPSNFSTKLPAVNYSGSIKNINSNEYKRNLVSNQVGVPTNYGQQSKSSVSFKAPSNNNPYLKPPLISGGGLQPSRVNQSVANLSTQVGRN